MGNVEGAAKQHAEALALARQAGRTDVEAMQLGNLGNVARAQDDLPRATSFQRQALILKRELGARRQIAITLADFASIAALDGRGGRAARLVGAALALRELIGTPQPVPERMDMERCIADVRMSLGAEQWSSELRAGREWAPNNRMSVPDWPDVQTMSTTRQPGLAARGLYSATPGDVRDPQTTQEQPTKPERIKMSGVRAEGSVNLESAYQNYLVFLNNSVGQASTLLLHDYVNRQGLYVASKDHPTPFLIYGDGTMLKGGDGVKIASETAQMSQQSILDVLERGTTQITPELIRSRFPTMARGVHQRYAPARAVERLHAGPRAQGIWSRA